MREVTTSDLSKFGRRELELFRALLNLWLDKGLPSEFHSDGVVPMLNTSSGYVFLTNSDYQVCMEAPSGELELWHYLPYSGEEGFLVDFEGREDLNEEDLEYLEGFRRERLTPGKHG